MYPNRPWEQIRARNRDPVAEVCNTTEAIGTPVRCTIERAFTFSPTQFTIIMRTVMIATIALCTLSGCTDDPLLPGHNPSVVVANLPPLPGTSYYELWVSRPASKSHGPSLDHLDAAYASIGSFVVQDNGAILDLGGGPASFVIPTDLDPGLLSDAIVTVQQHGDAPGVPGPRLLSGDFVGSETRAYDTLRMNGREAFGERLARDYSWCILDAPTSSDAADSTHGIWFVNFERDPTTDAIVDTLPGLNLAPLPTVPENAEWAYQSWLVRYAAGNVAEYVPMGHFMIPTEPDADGAGDGAGGVPSRHYSAPGGDFVAGLMRILNDGNYGVIVALERKGSAPSRPGIPILVRTLMEKNLPGKRSIELTPVAAEPTVTITLDR